MKKIPLRMCTGCGEMKPKKELVRVVRSKEGEISLDLVGKKSGRGAMKPFCINENCQNFLPEDKRGYPPRKTAEDQGEAPAEQAAAPAEEAESCLAQWPVQLKLTPVTAPCFQDAELLVAADCSAFACGNFHRQFMAGRTTLIGCPKLDGVDYAEKLTAILASNPIRSVTVVRMQVPCCGGLENAVKRAVQDCGKDIPCRTVVLSLDGQVLSQE